jgi:hypothetical protein
MCIAKAEAEPKKTRDLDKRQSRAHKNMKNMGFFDGERIDIIKGDFKGRQGTYLGKAGFISARLKIHGNSKDSRILWRTLRIASLQAITNRNAKS